MKIMAGIDKEWSGEAWVGEGVTVGYLEQEPQLDPTKNVRENVREGAPRSAPIWSTASTRSALMGDPDADFDALGTRWARLQDEDRRGRRLDLDNQLEIAMDACAARPATARSTTSRAARSAASRSPSCCSRSRPSCCSTSPPTTSTPRASSGWRTTSSTIRRGADRDPRPLLPRQRRRAGSSSSIAAAASPTRATTRPIWRRSQAPGAGGARGRRRARRRSSASSNGSAQPQGAPGQVQGPHQRFEELVEAQENRAPGKAQIVIQVPERLGGNVIEAKGLARPMATAAVRRPVASTCRPAASSA
jgi:hypothetical protein